MEFTFGTFGRVPPGGADSFCSVLYVTRTGSLVYDLLLEPSHPLRSVLEAAGLISV